MRFNSVIVAITALSLQGCNGCDEKKGVLSGRASLGSPGSKPIESRSKTTAQGQLSASHQSDVVVADRPRAVSHGGDASPRATDGEVLAVEETIPHLREEVARISNAVNHGVQLGASAFDRAIARSTNHHLVEPFIPADAIALLRRVEQRVANGGAEDTRPHLEAIAVEIRRFMAEDERWTRIVAAIESSETPEILRDRLAGETDAAAVAAAERLVSIKARGLALALTPEEGSIEDAAASLGHGLRVKDELINWAVNDRSVPDRLLLAGRHVFDQLEVQRFNPAQDVLSRMLESTVGGLQDMGALRDLFSRLIQSLLNGNRAPESPTGALRDAYTQLQLIQAGVHQYFDSIELLEFARNREELEHFISRAGREVLGIQGVPYLGGIRLRWEAMRDARRAELGEGEEADPAAERQGLHENEVIAQLLERASDPAITDEEVEQLRVNAYVSEFEIFAEFIQRRRETIRISKAIRSGVDFRGSSFEALVAEARHHDLVAPIGPTDARDLLDRVSVLRERPRTGTLRVHLEVLVEELEELRARDEMWRTNLRVLENVESLGYLRGRWEGGLDEDIRNAVQRLITIKAHARALQLTTERSMEAAAADVGAAMRVMAELEAWVADTAVPDRLIQGGVTIYEMLLNDKISPAVDALTASVVEAIPRLGTDIEASAIFDRVIRSLMGPEWRPDQPGGTQMLTETRETLEQVRRGVVWFLTHIDQLRAATNRAELDELIRRDTQELAQFDEVPYIETLRERWTQVRDQRLADLQN